jgi:hypothetical protein
VDANVVLGAFLDGPVVDESNFVEDVLASLMGCGRRQQAVL